MGRHRRPSTPESLRRIAKHSLILIENQADLPPERRLSEEKLRGVARRREAEGLLNDAGHYVHVPEM